ncbi:MAG: conjugal transfer protein, partial [Proteobacteria bacterium]
MHSNDEIRPPEPGPKPDVVTAENSSQVRGSFDIRAKRRGGGQNKKLWVGIGGIALIGLLAVGIMWTVIISQMSSDTTEVDDSKIKADAALAADPGYDESMAKAKAEQIRKMESEAKKAADLQAQEEEARNASKAGKGNSGTANRGARNVSAPADEDDQITPAQRKMSAAMIIKPEVQGGDAYSSAGSSEPSSAGAPSMPTSASVSSDGDMDSGGLEGGMRPRTRGSLSNMGGTSFSPAKAFLMPNRKYLVAHNTYTRCALYTEIVTDQPGLIDCRLTEPLYSSDGSTVIAEAGDKLTGEQ